MSFNITGGTLLSHSTKLSSTNATSLLPATLDAKKVIILSVAATELAGNTPALTIELNDGTTSYYGGLRKARNMVARATEVIDTPFVKPTRWTLKATAGAGDEIDVLVTFLSAELTAAGP